MIQEQFVKARALDGSIGADTNKQTTAFVDFEILDGDNRGEKITYRGQVNERSAKYTARDLKAIGWKGKDLATLKDDIAATHIETTIEIKHMNRKDGSGSFPVVRSIGRTASGGNAPGPVAQTELANANALLRAALGDNEPVEANSDDIPF